MSLAEKIAYLRKRNSLSQEELSEREYTDLRRNQIAKVEFEIDNLFQSTHKNVSGRLSVFCPILRKYTVRFFYPRCPQDILP